MMCKVDCEYFFRCHIWWVLLKCQCLFLGCCT